MTHRLAAFGTSLAAITLSACSGITDSSYALGPGDATYDALKAATDKCQAQGGVIRPTQQGDDRNLSNYKCVIGKAG